MEERDTDRLFLDMAKAVPGFDRVMREHIDDNGRVLDHVLMGDLTRHVLELAESGNRAPALAALECIENAFVSGSPYLQEVVVVSFIENLDPLVPVYKDLRARMGDSLLEELKQYEKIGWGTVPENPD